MTDKVTGDTPVEVKTNQGDSPNADWENNPNLDEKGNPKEVVAEVAPVVEPVVEVTADVVEPVVEEARTYDLDTPVVKQVEKLLTEAGLNTTDVAKIMSDNDGKPSPELIKQIADKHGDAVASIVVDQLSNFHKASVAKATAKDQAIYSQVEEAFKGVTEQGGKETWGELAGWAKENVPNVERAEINKLLSQGGLAAKYAIADLVNRFQTSDSFNVNAELLTGDNVVTTNGATPLSKADYAREFRALEAKGHVYGQSAELAALDKRRTAGLQRGI